MCQRLLGQQLCKNHFLNWQKIFQDGLSSPGANASLGGSWSGGWIHLICSLFDKKHHLDHSDNLVSKQKAVAYGRQLNMDWKVGGQVATKKRWKLYVTVGTPKVHSFAVKSLQRLMTAGNEMCPWKIFVAKVKADSTAGRWVTNKCASSL